MTFYKLQIESLSVTFHGHDLIVDTELELNYGRLVKRSLVLVMFHSWLRLLYIKCFLFCFVFFRRYGLLGLNGCGKSTLLTAIGYRELPIPEHMDIYHLTREIEASDMSALEAVICCDEERLRLEKEAEILAAQVC